MVCLIECFVGIWDWIFFSSLLDTNILFKDLFKTWSFGKYIYEMGYNQSCIQDSAKTTQQQTPTQVFFLLPLLRMYSPFPISFHQSGAVSWRLECLLGWLLVLIGTALKWIFFLMINWFLGKPVRPGKEGSWLGLDSQGSLPDQSVDQPWQWQAISLILAFQLGT